MPFVALKAERTREALPQGSNEPGLEEIAESRAVLQSMAKSLDTFLPGYSGQCSQKPCIKQNQFAKSPYWIWGPGHLLPHFVPCARSVFALGILQGGQDLVEWIFSSPQSLSSTTLTLAPMLSCTIKPMILFSHFSF